MIFPSVFRRWSNIAMLVALILFTGACSDHELKPLSSRASGKSDVVELHFVDIANNSTLIPVLSDETHATQDDVQHDDAYYLDRIKMISMTHGNRIDLQFAHYELVHTLEIAVYKSRDLVVGQKPIYAIECKNSCRPPWELKIIKKDTKQQTKLIGSQLEPGNVVIISTFVETQSSIGAKSWGVEVR